MAPVLRPILTAGFVLAVCGAAVQAQPVTAPPVDPARADGNDVRAVQEFERRVADYVLLHRRLEEGLPPLRPTSDVQDLRPAVEALAGRIRAARPDTRQGNLFTDDATPVFRRRIAECVPPERWLELAVELEEDDKGYPIRPVVLRVHMPWPATAPMGFMPPRLLGVLPVLPPELQYRFIGRALVVWDEHADLIVDFLPDAVAPLT